MTLGVAYLTWRTGRAVPLVAALLLALVVDITILYLRQSSRLRWRWRLLLLALRLAGLSTLALSVLQPAILRDARPSEQGAVVVIVDHSHSMSQIDRRQRSAQLVALADGLGLLPLGSRSTGDEWITAATELTRRLADLSDAQSRLGFARISGMSTIDAEGDLTAAVGKIAEIDDTLQRRRPRPVPRSILANGLAALHTAVNAPRGSDINDKWLPDLQKAVESVTYGASTSQQDADDYFYDHNPIIKAICDGLANKSRLGIVEESLTHPGSGVLYHLPAGAPLYGFAVGDRVEPLPLQGDGGKPVRRLILDTNNAGTNLNSAVRDALDPLRGTPVRAVVLFSDGRRDAPADAGVSGPGAPVFVVNAAASGGPRESTNDLSIAESPLPASVFAGETFTVRGKIYAVGFPPGRQQSVQCETDATPTQTRTVTIGRTEEAEVLFDVRFEQPGSHRVTLRLPDVPGEANSENNVAERYIKVLPGKIQIAVVTGTPTWDWRVARQSLASTPGFVVTGTPAFTEDAILLFDVPSRSVADAQSQRLDRYVRQRGGLLIAAPGADRPVMNLSANKVLANLLPFDASAAPAPWTRWNGDDPVYIFEPRGADSTERLRWASLPPVFRYLAPNPLRPEAQGLLFERQTGAAVAAQIPVGQGRVIFVGLDEIWRWGDRGNDAAGQFWVGLLKKWMGPPYAATDRVFSLDVEKAAVRPNESFDVRAKLVDSSDAAVIDIRILKGSAAVRQHKLPRVGPDQFASRLAGLPLGDYTVEASTDDRQQHRTISYPLHVVGAYGRAVENPAAGTAVLQRIADESGGHLLTLEQLRQLPAMLSRTAEVRVVPFRLWDSGYLFSFVVACFCAEWALRKRMGLA